MKKRFLSCVLLFVIALSLNGCFGQKDEDTPSTEPIEISTTAIPEVSASAFATWKEDEISYTPSVTPYTAEADFGNVSISESFYLNDADLGFLKKNLFVVTPSTYKEFFSIYEDNRYDSAPNFVTTDSILHTYHLYFDYLLRSLEEHELYDLAVKLTDEMIEKSEEQFSKLNDAENKDAAKRNVEFFTVAKKLLDPEFNVSDETAKKELELISAHQGISESYIFGSEDDKYLEDYSQYIPRGHYTKSEMLKNYFKGLMWYGRLSFRLKSSSETASALLIVSILENDEKILKDWDRLFEPINFFVGEPDDLVFYDYLPLAQEVLGENVDIEKLSKETVAQFKEKAKSLRSPSINSMVLIDPAIKPNDKDEETKGFRFLGQRSTIDATIFQQLVYRSVDENSDGAKRMLPKALDALAAMGSKEAEDILREQGDFEYAKYPEHMANLKKLLTEMPEANWTKNLYFGWTNTLRTLLKQYGEGYPSFMLNKAWKLKELITYLASFTELKHDTILYAKQVYAELGGPPPGEGDDRGYVEPNPELYNKLTSLIQFTIDGLNSRGILSSNYEEQLGILKELTASLRDISIKELEGKSLSDEDYELIRNYGGSLEHFWDETLPPEAKSGDADPLESSPVMLVADIATDPNGSVLEEGVGYVVPIFAVVPVDGKLRVARGGMFTHYEFTWPINDRLTDEKWREMLENWVMGQGEIPKMHEWVKEFMSSGE